MSFSLDNQTTGALFCIGAIILIFFLGWGLSLIFHMLFFSFSERIKKTVWKSFAVANNLNFVSARFPRKRAQVDGIYRGYHLTLKTIPKGENGQLYSQIIASVQNNHPVNQDNDTLTEQLLYGDTTHLVTSTNLSFGLKGDIDAKDRGRVVYCIQYGTERNTEYFQFLIDLLGDFLISYRMLVDLGGEAVPYLSVVYQKNRRLRPIIRQMLQEIGHETKRKLGHRVSGIVCQNCLTNFGTHEVRLSFGLPITYYGCRLCGQSRKYFDGRVFAVLDNRDMTRQIQHDGSLRVNWLVNHSLFDFNEVEILQATDEEIERFVVKVGNDTDSFRKRRYKKMNCRIATDCELAENSVRILAHTFGHVVQT